MNLPTVAFTVRWLVQDTFRQARASGIHWLMLGLSGICILFCLTIDTVNLPSEPKEGEPGLEVVPKAVWEQLPPEKREGEGITYVDGQVTYLFGAQRVSSSQYKEVEVRHVQFFLVQWGADTAGVLLALIWTAGFLPTFLQPSSASVLLAKPIPRWTLLAGKYFGVLVFVAFQLAVFVFGTWLALAFATGYWDGRYLLCLPVVLIHFAVFFSFSVLLAVATRSTVSCVFGSLVFWLIAWGMNYGRHAAMLIPELRESSPFFLNVVELGYWVLPKPADMGIMMVQALDASRSLPLAFDVEGLKAQRAWSPEASLFSSVAFALVMLIFAARDFVTTDY